jgi:hypothetical protein
MTRTGLACPGLGRLHALDAGPVLPVNARRMVMSPGLNLANRGMSSLRMVLSWCTGRTGLVILPRILPLQPAHGLGRRSQYFFK